MIANWGDMIHNLENIIWLISGIVGNMIVDDFCSLFLGNRIAESIV